MTDIRDDTAASLGITFFEPRLPPIRVPKPAPGAFNELKLDFRDDRARASFTHACQAEVRERCMAGARHGCSKQAASRCRGNAILQFLGLQKRPTWVEVDACEEVVMAACMAEGEAQCSQHATDFCAIAVRPKSRK